MTVLAWIIAATAPDAILSAAAAGLLILNREPFELPVLISVGLEQWGSIRRRAVTPWS